MTNRPGDVAPDRSGLVPVSGFWFWLILAVLFIGALTVRVYRLDMPPLDIHPTRQFHSALIAREMYLHSIDAPRSQQELAEAASEESIEPPIIEWLSVRGYLMVGHENLAIPRLISIFCWLAGGAFLFLAARQLTTVDEAVFAVSFYLLTPYAVRFSRVFQPEPMMLMLTLAAVWLLTRWGEQRSTARALAAGIAAILAVVVKPPSIFPILGIWAALLLLNRGKPRDLLKPDIVIFGTAVAIAVAYYAYDVLISGRLSSQVSVQFHPSFWGTTTHWAGWFQMIGRVFNHPAFIGAVLGTFIVQRRMLRFILVGWWLSYLIIGQVFSYAIATHDYYQILFIPLIGLGCAVFLAPTMKRLADVFPRKSVQGLLVVSMLVIACALRARDLRFGSDIVEAVNETLVADAREIGDVVDHSIRTTMLSEAYCGPIQYYGEVAGLCWPTADVIASTGLSAEDVFAEVVESSDYFVVTYAYEYARQTDLREILAAYPELKHTDRYIVYDLRTTE
jgi:hypothetical protein